MIRLWQRLCAIAAVIAFTLSLTAHGVVAMPMAETVADTLAMAQTSSDACDDADCAAHDLAAVCYAVCGASMAVPVATSMSHIADGPRHGFWAPSAQLGLPSPPDPSPPRASNLS